jgi:hypothetical protein
VNPKGKGISTKHAKNEERWLVSRGGVEIYTLISRHQGLALTKGRYQRLSVRKILHLLMDNPSRFNMWKDVV